MPIRRWLLPVVCLLWAGACIGVAFAEGEKFRAPSLSRNAAVDVGRTVFHAWQEVQFGPMVLVLLGAIGGRLPRSASVCVTVAWTVLLFQTVLLQALLAQADTLLAGGVPTALLRPRPVRGVRGPEGAGPRRRRDALAEGGPRSA
jgi:hypothetical protein